MTNREVIMQGLQTHTDSVVDYIECPYILPEDCLNEQRDPDGIRDYEDPVFKDTCRQCKMLWLEKEWKND